MHLLSSLPGTFSRFLGGLSLISLVLPRSHFPRDTVPFTLVKLQPASCSRPPPCSFPLINHHFKHHMYLSYSPWFFPRSPLGERCRICTPRPRSLSADISDPFLCFLLTATFVNPGGAACMLGCGRLAPGHPEGALARQMGPGASLWPPPACFPFLPSAGLPMWRCCWSVGFLWETLSLGSAATLRLGRAFQVAGRQRQPGPPLGQVAEGALCDPLLGPASSPLPCGRSGAPD